MRHRVQILRLSATVRANLSGQSSVLPGCKPPQAEPLGSIDSTNKDQSDRRRAGECGPLSDGFARDCLSWLVERFRVRHSLLLKEVRPDKSRLAQ